MEKYDVKTRSVLDEVNKYYGIIPRTYYATADAGVLPNLWALATDTFKSGASAHEDKRICAAVIAHTLGIQELLSAHFMILKRYMDWNKEDFDGLLKEEYPSRMSDNQILYAKLAKTLALNPANVDREILQTLQVRGISKEAIAEIIALHGFVRYMATFVSVYDMVKV